MSATGKKKDPHILQSSKNNPKRSAEPKCNQDPRKPWIPGLGGIRDTLNLPGPPTTPSLVLPEMEIRGEGPVKKKRLRSKRKKSSETLGGTTQNYFPRKIKTAL